MRNSTPPANHEVRNSMQSTKILFLLRPITRWETAFRQPITRWEIACNPPKSYSSSGQSPDEKQHSASQSRGEKYHAIDQNLIPPPANHQMRNSTPPANHEVRNIMQSTKILFLLQPITRWETAHRQPITRWEISCNPPKSYSSSSQSCKRDIVAIVRASDSQCRSRNCPGFDPSILRHSGIWGAADEAVLNKVHTIVRATCHWVEHAALRYKQVSQLF